MPRYLWMSDTFYKKKYHNLPIYGKTHLFIKKHLDIFNYKYPKTWCEQKAFFRISWKLPTFVVFCYRQSYSLYLLLHETAVAVTAQSIMLRFCFFFACKLISYKSTTYRFSVKIGRYLKVADFHPALTAIGEKWRRLWLLLFCLLLKNKLPYKIS